MAIRKISRDRLASENRYDPVFYVHPSATREWSVPRVQLRDLAEIHRRERQEEPEEGIPILDDNPGGNPLNPPVRKERPEGSVYIQRTEPGDVIMHRSNPEKCLFTPRSLFVSYDYWVCTCQPRIRPEYVVLVLRSSFLRDELERRSTGQVRRRVSREHLGSLPVPLPDLSRQDTFIDLYKEERKPGEHEGMEETLRDITRNAGYTETSDMNPHYSVRRNRLEDRLDPGYYRDPAYTYRGTYERRELEQIVRIQVGRRETANGGQGEDSSGTSSSNEYHVLKGGDMKTGLIHRPDPGKTSREPVGDRLVAKAGDIVAHQYVTGRRWAVTVIPPGPAYILSAHLLRLRIEERQEVDPVYLGALFAGPAMQDEIRRRAVPSSRRHLIGKSRLASLRIPLPEEEKQRKWTSRFQTDARTRAPDESESPADRLVRQYLLDTS